MSKILDDAEGMDDYMKYSEGYGGTYRQVCGPLTDNEIVSIVAKILDSKRFAFGEYSHVVLKGTKTIVGFVGDDSVDLCFPKGESPRIYKIPHSHLTRIFKSV